MEVVQAIICAAGFGAAGALIPRTIRPLVEMKLQKRGRTLAPSVQDKPWFAIVLAVISAAIGGVFGFYGDNIPLILAIFVIYLASVAFGLIDKRIHIIPNEMVLAMIPIAALFQLYSAGWMGLLKGLAAMAALVVVFAILGLIFGFEKMGAGDVKLLGIMGLVLGFPMIIYGLFIMSIALVVFSLIGMAMGKMTHVSMIPLAPFMMLGQVAALILLISPLQLPV